MLDTRFEDVPSEISNLSRSKQKKLRRLGLLEEATQAVRHQQEINRLRLKQVKPITINQSHIFKQYTAGQNLLVHGLPGTGKSYLAMYLALSDVVEAHTHSHVKIIRSVVPGRDIGFLPGTEEEKIAVFARPYENIVNELFGKSHAWKTLKAREQVSFESTSFLRGDTFRDAIVVVDEIQNMTWAELYTVMTRLGDNCRIVFCGDFRQTDLNKKQDRQGLFDFMGVLKSMNQFSHIEMGIDDIVRSGIVKQFIIAAANKNLV